MNKLLFLFLLVSFSFMCNNSDVQIKTNYYDLPVENAEQLKEHFDTDDLSFLDIKNLSVVKNYIENNVLGFNNPLYNSISTNYFWFIYNALPSFVSEKERHSGYYENENKQDLNEKLIAYSIYRIDRSPENIQKIFDLAKPKLKDIVSQSIYEKLNISVEVNSLLASYERIIRIENYKKHLTEAYSQVDTTTGKYVDYGEGIKFRKYVNDAYGFTASDVNEIVEKHLGNHDIHNSYGSKVSFWMRRNHEGNMETVYEILKEIKSIYN